MHMNDRIGHSFVLELVTIEIKVGKAKQTSVCVCMKQHLFCFKFFVFEQVSATVSGCEIY